MEQHRIPLKKQGGIVIGHAIVDECDHEYLSQWVWRMDKDGYAIRFFRSPSAGRTKCGKYNKLVKVIMHREVGNRIGLSRSKEVDHINKVKADNRRSNLRSATRHQQMWNIPKHTDNTSGVIGVVRQKGTQKWIAQITVRSKGKYLGTFNSLEDAVAARNKAVLERDSEFAVLSEVPV
jgi:hypothetical protein